MEHLKIFVYCFASRRVLINWRQVNLNTAKDAANQSCYVEIENAYYNFDNIKLHYKMCKIFLMLIQQIEYILCFKFGHVQSMEQLAIYDFLLTFALLEKKKNKTFSTMDEYSYNFIYHNT
ncbi:hypothetical protein T02_993 [Trichinella nativa]|uniref:Uncharacterized protein n=1 Tax=Trichinella nativa TaxID=6335 RepID=A0A0V1KQA4_9BILA|nr:hypothetical protein T02_993 [Trichinella nativa]